MSSNGRRRPPRPEVVVTSGTASPDEAAAITAALERFLAENAPTARPTEVSRWQRAGLSEGVGRASELGIWGP